MPLSTTELTHKLANLTETVGYLQDELAAVRAEMRRLRTAQGTTAQGEQHRLPRSA